MAAVGEKINRHRGDRHDRPYFLTMYHYKMRKSRLSQNKQNKLIELFVAGVTARTESESVNVNKTTAAYYFHRLRLLIYPTVVNSYPFFLVQTNTSLSINNINFHVFMQNNFCILPIFATIPQLFMRKNDESPRSTSNRNEYTPMGTC